VILQLPAKKGGQVKAINIVEMAVPYISQTLEDSEDLITLARPMLNTALQEVLEVENGIRKTEGKEELAEAPYLEKEDLSEDVPYSPALVRRALPYWLAYRFLLDDDQDARAQLYYNEYVNALNEARKMTQGEVEDVYA
jgi:hypothetical protein